MHMRDWSIRFSTLALIVTAVVMGLAGCGGGGSESGSDTSVAGKVVAGKIDDGATALLSTQIKCPVCGEPIKKEVHTKPEENRVYFDKQECLERYRENTEKYGKKLLRRR